MTAEAQRARRALRRLRLSPAQARAAEGALREERLRLEAVRQLLAECRRELRQALARPAPDSAVVLEVATQERLLERRESELAAALESRLSGLLQPEQAARLRALPRAVLGDVVARLCAESAGPQPTRSTAAPRPRSRSESRA